MHAVKGFPRGFIDGHSRTLCPVPAGVGNPGIAADPHHRKKGGLVPHSPGHHAHDAAPGRIALLVVTGEAVTPDYGFEVLGLAVSALMLAGIYHISPLFIALARSQEAFRSMNAKLSSLSEEQRLLLDHTKDFIYRHDPSGQISYVSPAVEGITGYRPDEWLVHYSHHYTDNPVNQNGHAATEEMLKTGTGGPPFVVEVKHKDGCTVWLEINKQPYAVDGKVAGFIGVARDITQRMQLEEEREDLIAELQEALAGIRTLKGLLPICASCKKVRDDKGYWNQIEAYVSEHSEAEFTHGLCPECAQKLYPRYYEKT
jgi:PAS domain S-box-containing protein